MAIIKIVGYEKHGKVAVVDDEDYGKVSRYQWFLRVHRAPTFYTHAHVFGRTRLMHQIIIPDKDVPFGFERSHLDGDGLNNRKNNLKVVTKLENLQHKRMYDNNTSGTQGVSFCKLTSRWHAYIRKESLGRYNSLEAAIAARKAAEAKYRGEEKE